MVSALICPTVIQHSLWEACCKVGRISCAHEQSLLSRWQRCEVTRQSMGAQASWLFPQASFLSLRKRLWLYVWRRNRLTSKLCNWDVFGNKSAKVYRKYLFGFYLISISKRSGFFTYCEMKICSSVGYPPNVFTWLLLMPKQGICCWFIPA